MTFGRALLHMRAGLEVRRASWHPTLTLELRALTIVILCRVATTGTHVSPWLPTHAALLAEDWEAVARPRKGRRATG